MRVFESSVTYIIDFLETIIEHLVRLVYVFRPFPSLENIVVLVVTLECFQLFEVRLGSTAATST